MVQCPLLISAAQPDKHQTDTSLLVPENFAVAFWLVSSFDVYINSIIILCVSS